MEKCPSATYTAVLAILILVIGSTQWQSVKGETFYIEITPRSPFCNESGADPHHCLTLQQFFTKFILNELNPTHLTLELEPGEHILDYNLTITTLVSFVMTSEAATINCTSPTLRYFLLHFLEDVLISGITFMDCGLLEIYNTGNFRFENSSIYEYDYGNIYSLRLDSVIEGAIIGSTFLQNHYSGQLGVVNGSMIRIQECTFSHINAHVPVISSWDSTFLIIDSTTFENITHGTAVRIMNNQESVTITNCDFINNNIGNHSETQGLLSIDSHGSIEIRGNRFAQNTGKVLNITSVNETTIDQNNFIDNAGPGAALDISATSVVLTISQNNFTRNTDGAINLLVSDSHVTVDDCNFSGNTKNKNGGAAMTVYEHDYEFNKWDSALFTISQSSFFNNSAIINGSGGALHIGVDSPLSGVIITSSIFSHNHASRAGAVYINASANCTFGTIMTTFDNNVAAEGHGGAITTEGELLRRVSLLHSTFTNNTAPRSCGGAVYIDAAHTVTDRSTFLNNSAQNCGALALNSGHIRIDESNFLSNKAEANGGAICTSADMSEVVISFGNFSYNHAERNGGVVIIEPQTNEHYESNSTLFLINGPDSFEYNTAGSQGGVFAIFSRSIFRINFTSFFNNQAGVEGGVMYVRDTNSSVSISTVSKIGFNRAEKRGGVISINGSSLLIGDTNIFNNSADMGAVISACSANVSISPLTLYHYNDPNFPNCLLYDVIEPSTVTTPTIPPTRAHHFDSGIAVAVALPIVVFLVFATILTAALSYAYCRKCKKSVGIARFKKLETDDPDLAPLTSNA